METIKRQANWLKESVAKQQQAVLKTFAGAGAPHHSETVVTDEAELKRHQQLEKLYTATRTGKHFQRDIVKGIEGVIATGIKQSEHYVHLSEACRKFTTEGHSTGGPLAKAAIHSSLARSAIEKERELFHRNLGSQIVDPLKAMINGSPLDDARTLTQRYDKLRQEAEAQNGVVFKLNQKVRDGTGGPDASMKLQQAEQRMNELSAAMAVLGKEAASAMMAVEAQQQRLTLQRLIALVETEKAFHQRAVDILDQVVTQMVMERQKGESMPPSASAESSMPPTYEEVRKYDKPPQKVKKGQYFLAEVIHPFYAEGDGELALDAGDFVVVRQISPNGWAEGEYKGKAGWFPLMYVERRQRVPASKVIQQVS